MKKLSLNGNWELSFADQRSGKNECIAATVPGDVHVDMMKAGLLEEPLYGNNLEKSIFIEEMDFVYERDIFICENFMQQVTELVFYGLDMCADIYLNGEKIRSSNNTHITVRTDVTGKLKVGKNRLKVRIDSGLRQVGDRDPAPYAYDEAQPEEDHRRVFIRKPQFTFRWDNIPHLLPCGIYRDVEVQTFQSAMVKDVYLTNELYLSSAHVTTESEISCFKAGKYTLSALLTHKKTRITKVIEIQLKEGINKIKLTLDVPNPCLWWPNGYGDQPLYDFALCISQKGAELDTWNTRHGIRVVKIIQDSLGDEGESFIVVVNGKKIFCKGSDWVPVDALSTRVTDEKYIQLIDRAVECNHNMFRVWGGGMYENDIFYDLCDSHGILLWHDFMFACSYYPDEDNEFVDNCLEEFECAIRRLRNHSSLALWCGNNEMQWIDWQQVNRLPVVHGFNLVEKILPEKVHELDPARYFHMSSPYGSPEDSNKDPNSDLRGDSHIWLPDGKAPEYGVGGIGLIDYTGFAKRSPKFASEYGILAPPTLASIRKYTPEDQLFVGSQTWDVHNDTWDKGSMDKRLELYYHKRDEKMSFQETIDALQMLQGEAYKYCTEHMRRRMFNTSGSLFWMFADCWGGVSWTVIDYYMNLLPSFYYIKRVYAPIIVSLAENGDKTEVWVINDTDKEFYASLVCGEKSFDGELELLKTESVNVPAASSKMFKSIDMSDLAGRDDIYTYVALIEDGKVISENRLFHTTYGKIKLGVPRLDIKKIQLSSNLIRVDISCGNFARMVLIEGPEGLVMSDNAFDIGAGENKTVWIEGKCDTAALTIRTMNDYVI
ncbi:MAG TPA: sugar-binding domain-containing protein [Ruminiclostridium sp.]